MYQNTISVIGRLVADVQFKKGDREDGSNDRSWARLAVNPPGKDRDAYFMPFVCWGATARAVNDHTQKGKELALSGELRTRTTQREDGSYDNYFEINCHSVSFGADAKNTKGAPAPATDAKAPVFDEATLKAMAAILAAAQGSKQAPTHDEASPFDIPTA